MAQQLNEPGSFGEAEEKDDTGTGEGIIISTPDDIILTLKGVPEYNTYPNGSKSDSFFFMASIKAPRIDSGENANEDAIRAPLDLVCVLDESGSMAGGRIALLKETLGYIINNLTDHDRFGLVGYSSASRMILSPLTKMNNRGKAKAQQLSSGLYANGGTALCAGLCSGINLCKSEMNNRNFRTVMLLTDGQANIGYTKAEDIIRATIDKEFAIAGMPKSSYSSKSSSPSKPGDWNCPSCGYSNFSKRRTCNKCGTGKPGGYQKNRGNKKSYNSSRKGRKGGGGKPGDWDCNQCGTMNFAKRKFCFSCSAPKSVANNNNNTFEGNEGNNDNNNNNNDNTFSKPVVDDGKLHCEINTFGFGADHNEKLLSAIAEHGNGMYAYIENTNKIAEIFAECLGGLVSIIGLQIKVRIEALGNVLINKILSTGYKINEIEANKIYEIIIENIQSEESRDFLFELTLPENEEGDNDNDNNQPIISLNMEYTNVIKDKKEKLSYICNIKRDNIDIADEMKNEELDKQNNRVTAVNYMKKAHQLGNEGKFQEAQNLLIELKEKINNSVSKDDIYSVNLISDINKLIINLENGEIFRQKGGKMLEVNSKAHELQRSVESNMFASQMHYENKYKYKMKEKFLRGDWICPEQGCGFKNFAIRSICKNCGKGNRPSKPGDWTCNICNVLNFASRSACFKCYSSKGSVHMAKTQKPGDWICNQCNVNNFAKRTKCFKCGVNKSQ